MRHWIPLRSHPDSLLGPALLLVLIVALPTSVMLWMMNEAMQNERLAVRQRLIDVYRSQLETARRDVVASWQLSMSQMDTVARENSPMRTFAACVERGIADSVIVLDQNGKPEYPTSQNASDTAGTPDDANWRAAKRLEFVDRDYINAALAYEGIANETDDDEVAVRALQSQIRSLFAAGNKTMAIKRLRETIADTRLHSVHSSDGRWLAANLMLLLIESTKATDPETSAEAADHLAEQMNNYDQAWPSSAQRRFMLHTLEQLYPGKGSSPLLAAEDLASECLERTTDPVSPGVLQLSPMSDVWTVLSPDKRIQAIFRSSNLRSRLTESLNQRIVPAGASFAITEPDVAAGGQNEFLAIPLGAELPRWKISLTLADDPFSVTAFRRNGIYFWTALLTIMATASLTLLVAIALRHQMRLSRLKADLVATVSHELKTPVSSIRLLVETLLEQDPMNVPQAREYLEMISRENIRLSRLIENFLTFSRIERGKHQLTKEIIEPGDIARQACDALRDRLVEPNCHFDLSVQPDLPPVFGDMDALVTALVNLLDNSLKFSREPKRIELHVSSQSQDGYFQRPAGGLNVRGVGCSVFRNWPVGIVDCNFEVRSGQFRKTEHPTPDQSHLARKRGVVCFTVTDNGIGISTRHLRRIFDQFYQVDQHLTRPAGGCGLGLSIVRSIVNSHGGTVEVESELGQRSTFRLILPAFNSTENANDPCTTS